MSAHYAIPTLTTKRSSRSCESPAEVFSSFGRQGERLHVRVRSRSRREAPELPAPRLARLGREQDRAEQVLRAAGGGLVGEPGLYRGPELADQFAEASALDVPMLILQGGRDYQVTIADDLAGWEAGLGHRTNVTIRVHEAADHLFFAGDGPSTPADYLKAQHVDPAVISGIADWLTTR